MKNKLKLFIIVISGIFIPIMLFTMTSFKSSKSEKEYSPAQTSSKITSIGSTSVYKLNVDNSQYIIVVGRAGDAVAIIKHR